MESGKLVDQDDTDDALKYLSTWWLVQLQTII